MTFGADGDPCLLKVETLALPRRDSGEAARRVYAARIQREASLPIVDAFGLQVDANGLVQTLQPFAMEFDCTLGVGTNLYVAR
jgi:hypothetical protein